MNYWQLIQNHIQMLRDITGMNEMTDGSTPDPRTLTTVAKLAYEGTNNALYSIVQGDKFLLEDLSNDIILRLQDVAETGEVKGYIRALGSNTMKFFKMSSNVALYEFGIFLEDKPTDDQRAMLMQQVQAGQAGGMLDIEDAIIIQNTDNLKVAQQLLAFKIKKRREQEEEKAMRMQQINAEVQQQSAQAAEQAKQQTIQVEGQVKAQLIQVEQELESKLLQMKYEIELRLEEVRQGGKANVKSIENKGKKAVTKIRMGQPDLGEDEVVEEMSMPSEAPEQEMYTGPVYQAEAMPEETMQEVLMEHPEGEQVVPAEGEALPTEAVQDNAAMEQMP
jgi:hypothetical protein